MGTDVFKNRAVFDVNTESTGVEALFGYYSLELMVCIPDSAQTLGYSHTLSMSLVWQAWINHTFVPRCLWRHYLWDLKKRRKKTKLNSEKKNYWPDFTFSFSLHEYFYFLLQSVWCSVRLISVPEQRGDAALDTRHVWTLQTAEQRCTSSACQAVTPRLTVEC